MIDAIGCICFYDNTDYPLEYLIDCFNEKGNDEIIRWKTIRAFACFSTEAVLNILRDIIESDDIVRIRKEAESSLNIIIKKSADLEAR